MSGSDWASHAPLHIPRDPNLADLSRHVPHGKMPAANTPEQITAACKAVAAYVATAVEAGHRAEAYHDLADMLGLT